MVIQKNCKFITKANSPIISNTFSNASGDILSLQISGSNGIYHLEGRNSSDGHWVSLAGISLQDFSVTSTGFTKAGLYEIGIIGVRELRVRAESIEGEVTIFGQIISSEEV